MSGFKLGGVTPDNVKMGSDQVDKIYMGSTVVWEALSPDLTFNTLFSSTLGSNFLSTANMSDHNWGTTYNMDGLQCVNNLGVAMFFDSSADATTFMDDVPPAGIAMRVDQNDVYGGPGPLRVCPKSALSKSGSVVSTTASFANTVIQDMSDLMSNGNISETFLDFA